MDREEKIKKERVRLAALFIDLRRDKFYALLKLIDRAAYLAVLLEEMEADLEPTDEYKNGRNQEGRKMSAELAAYNQTTKLYQKIIKELMVNLPVNSDYRPPGSDEHALLAFRRFMEDDKLDFYLSEEFAQRQEDRRKRAIELMLEGK